MRFKTKDLLVTVLPQAERLDPELAKRCLLNTRICTSPTLCRAPSLCIQPTCAAPSLQCHPAISQCARCSLLVSCGHCTQLQSIPCDCSLIASIPCGGFSCGGGSACDPTLACGLSDIIIENIEDLVTIKNELRETLKALEQMEAKGLPSAFSSRDEAEAIEKSLEEALAQVRAQKKNLK
ncbi:MAG TPA: hypothetical protein VF017_17310 [Thermoanaerobaculia bacterium]|nr:hypothetical protein [Thermoanaerobaculia bacterium]